MRSSPSLSLLMLPLVEVVLMGLLAGLVGAVALVHRRIFFTESLTHATFPGAILGVVVASWFSRAVLGQRADFELLSVMVLVGAALMCLPMTWLMRWLSQVPGLSSQSAAGIVLTLGFALGYFLNSWFKPLPLKVDSFLTGSVLNVGLVDVAAVAVVLVVAVAVLVVGGRRLTFYSFDALGYRASGLSATAPRHALPCGLAPWPAGPPGLRSPAPRAGRSGWRPGAHRPCAGRPPPARPPPPGQ